MEVRRAKLDDYSAYFMLWQFYLYDSSGYEQEDINDIGHFQVDEGYLRGALKGDVDCRPYLIVVDNRIAGFIAVEHVELAGRTVRELGDIFVMRKYRRRGIAKYAIARLLGAEPGEWCIMIFKKDLEAMAFWKRIFDTLSFSKVEAIESSEATDLNTFIVNYPNKVLNATAGAAH